MNAATLSAGFQIEGASKVDPRVRSILEQKITGGMRSAANLVERIHTEQSRDQIVMTTALNFSARAGSGVEVTFANGGPGDFLVPTDHALAQMAGRAIVPSAYLRELSKDPQDWKRDLACEILERSYRNGPAERILSRSVNGELRGWLSDKYRRLDSRPLVDALAAEAQAVGAVPFDGVSTSTRVALKVILPRVIEVAGDAMLLGVEWSNSDYGNGTHSVRAFAIRVMCLNGMTRENLMKQVHLGGRLGDDVAFSERTYRLDTATSVSALQDVVRGALGAGGMESTVGAIQKAASTEFSSAQLERATRNATKEQQKKIVDAYEGMDVVNLPPNKTAWRASNAISWIARAVESDEQRLDLERLAGSLV
jgi:hypothetical protein